MISEKQSMLKIVQEKELISILDSLTQNNENNIDRWLAKFKIKNELLCGSLAQMFALLVLEKTQVKKRNVKLVFLWSPNLMFFEDLKISNESFKSSHIHLDPDKLATHAVVEVEYKSEGENKFVIDPTAGVIYQGTVRKIRNQAKVIQINSDEKLVNMDFVSSKISDNNRNSKISYRMFYATSFYWNSVIGQTYVNNLDSKMNEIT